MRSAGLPGFRKLYAKIDVELPAGTYNFVVSNGVPGPTGYTNPWTGQPQEFLYPVGAFGGTKKLVLSTAGWIGGKNFFLGYACVHSMHMQITWPCACACIFLGYACAYVHKLSTLPPLHSLGISPLTPSWPLPPPHLAPHSPP